MEIIKASILDLSALRKLEQESFQKDAWPLFDLIAVLTFPLVVRFKAVEDDQMAGFIAGDPHPGEGWGWIAKRSAIPRATLSGLSLKDRKAQPELLPSMSTVKKCRG